MDFDDFVATMIVIVFFVLFAAAIFFLFQSYS